MGQNAIWVSAYNQKKTPIIIKKRELFFVEISNYICSFTNNDNYIVFKL